MATTDSESIITGVASELKANPPKQLARTKEKFGTKVAARQRVAILLSKARKLGARVPKPGKSKS